MNEFYSASDVARLSGATLRSVRYWALTQVLQATPDSDRAGTGKHRQFSPDEVVIACILNYFAGKGLQVGELGAISNAIREVSRRTGHSIIWDMGAAIKDDDKLYMIIKDGGGYILMSGRILAVNCEGLFTSLNNQTPGFIAVLLNGLFSRLRSEWT